MEFRLLLLALGAFVGTTESTLVPGLLPAIGDSTGVSVAQAGYLVVGYSLAYAIAAPIMSSLFSAADRRRTLAAGELILGMSALALALAPAFPLMIIARSVLAIGAVLFTSLAQSTAYALAPPERRGRSVGFVMTGGTLAMAVGAPLFALVGVHFGWRVAYGLVAALAVVSGTIMWIRLPAGIVGERRTITERLAVLGYRGVPTVLLIGMLFGLSAFLPNIYMAAITTGAMGMGSQTIPLALLAYGLGAVAGGLLGGQMVDRLGPYRTLLIFGVATAMILLLIPALPRLPAPYAGAAWLLDLGALGLVGWGLFGGLINILASLAPREVPLVISLNLTAGSLGGAIAAFIGGLAIERFGPASVGFVGAGFTIVALGLTMGNRDILSPSTQPARLD